MITTNLKNWPKTEETSNSETQHREQKKDTQLTFLAEEQASFFLINDKKCEGIQDEIIKNSIDTLITLNQ